MTRFLIRLLVAMALTGAGGHAAAEFPDKPIRLVVPFPAGGPTDVAVRAIAQHLQKSLGQQLVIDCRPGADGQIASVEVAHAAPDGYTLLFGSASGLSFVPVVRKTPPYDTLRDFTPVAGLFVVRYMLYVHASLPVHSVADLVDYARAHPDKLSYGTATATAFLTMSDWLAQAKASMVHVPYKGEASAQGDLLSNRIQVMFATPSTFRAHVKAGSLRALAISDAMRSATDPEVPSFSELGMPPMKVLPWLGVVGPAGLPADIVERLSSAFNLALESPEVREQAEKLGFTPTGSSPAEMSRLLKEQLELMRRAVRDGHVAAD